MSLKKKEDFIKEIELNEDFQKTFKLLIENEVEIVERIYKNSAEWDKAFLAKYKNNIIEFSFSTGADKRETKWLISKVWESLQENN
ncbi:hypothetical protein [Gaetbulibacter sp. PBL-D1]|uniref:hypothetical protein n=1 Tax=Gaetbulibacter sp. PBL-D1 TaxID=3422594 RepID=UPI003D2F455B